MSQLVKRAINLEHFAATIGGNKTLGVCQYLSNKVSSGEGLIAATKGGTGTKTTAT